MVRWMLRLLFFYRVIHMLRGGFSRGIIPRHRHELHLNLVDLTLTPWGLEASLYPRRIRK